jgi:hypothetical protein
MDWLQGELMITGLFALRLGVPVLVLLLIGRLLRGLEKRWDNESEAVQQAQPVARPVGRTVRAPKLALLADAGQV